MTSGSDGLARQTLKRLDVASDEETGVLRFCARWT